MGTVKAFIIKKDDKVLYVGLDTDLTPQEYNKVVQEALHNQELELKEKERLEKRVADLEQAVKDLKHEIKIDRGEE